MTSRTPHADQASSIHETTQRVVDQICGVIGHRHAARQFLERRIGAAISEAFERTHIEDDRNGH